MNAWFQVKGIPLHLPSYQAMPGEEQPVRLEGARVVKIGGIAKIGGRAAAFLAYRMQTGPVSLMVTPDAVAMATGGVEVKFKEVTFHYGMVDGYRVVTWSVHGLTYALVSHEAANTQRSCMVCHAARKDRDLSQTPSPLSLTGTEGFLH